jgi:hypothetical protein
MFRLAYFGQAMTLAEVELGNALREFVVPLTSLVTFRVFVAP